MGVLSLPTDKRLLAALGIATPQGRLRRESLRKVRQIEGMLPWLIQAVSHSSRGPATIVEFGCGKGYLSFFLASACRERRLAPVRIVGVDRDGALVRRCAEVRDALGWEELEFVAATCEEFAIRPAPVLVTSLHACDSATDHVLAAGVALGAEHIVAAPCCHFTTQRTLREAGHRHAWGYIARSFPLLGSRLSEFITDGMRCLSLRAHGYEVQVREFVSGTATPKNIVLLARREGLRGTRAAAELRLLERTLRLRCEVEGALDRRRALLPAHDASGTRSGATKEIGDV